LISRGEEGEEGLGMVLKVKVRGVGGDMSIGGVCAGGQRKKRREKETRKMKASKGEETGCSVGGGRWAELAFVARSREQVYICMLA